MELRLVFIVVLCLGGIDLANILRGKTPAASAEKVAHPVEDDDATKDWADVPLKDEWSETNQGVRISYCTSCSMKGAFMQVKQYVEQEFPGTPLIGETYPIAPQKEVLKRLVTGAQIGVAVMMFAGEHVLSALKLTDPQYTNFLARMREKKFPVLMGTWMLGNMVQNGLSSTGAFEVFSGGEQIFSKLETGRLPHLEELYDGLVRTLRPLPSE